MVQRYAFPTMTATVVRWSPDPGPTPDRCRSRLESSTYLLRLSTPQVPTPHNERSASCTASSPPPTILRCSLCTNASVLLFGPDTRSSEPTNVICTPPTSRLRGVGILYSTGALPPWLRTQLLPLRHQHHCPLRAVGPISDNGMPTTGYV